MIFSTSRAGAAREEFRIYTTLLKNSRKICENCTIKTFPKTIDFWKQVCYNKNVNKRYTKTKRKEVLKNGKNGNLILYL